MKRGTLEVEDTLVTTAKTSLELHQARCTRWWRMLWRSQH